MEMKVSIVGAGKMAIALAKGLVRTNTVKAVDICGSAPDKLGMANQLHAFKAQGSRTTHDNLECINGSDLVFIMTKGGHSLSKSAFLPHSFVKKKHHDYFDTNLIACWMFSDERYLIVNVCLHIRISDMKFELLLILIVNR